MALVPKPYIPRAPSVRSRGVPVVPSDTVDLEFPTQGIWVGATGDLRVNMAGQTSPNPVNFLAIESGTYLPIAVTRIFATGTSAQNMVALY